MEYEVLKPILNIRGVGRNSGAVLMNLIENHTITIGNIYVWSDGILVAVYSRVNIDTLDARSVLPITAYRSVSGIYIHVSMMDTVKCSACNVVANVLQHSLSTETDVQVCDAHCRNSAPRSVRAVHMTYAIVRGIDTPTYTMVSVTANRPDQVPLMVDLLRANTTICASGCCIVCNSFEVSSGELCKKCVSVQRMLVRGYLLLMTLLGDNCGVDVDRMVFPLYMSRVYCTGTDIVRLDKL